MTQLGSTANRPAVSQLAHDIQELDVRIEGWIAGLQLAALSMQHRPDPAGLIADLANAIVLGVSPDTVDSRRRFREAHGLPFHLLVDRDKAVATDWDAVVAPTDDNGNTRYGIKRSQYVIDEQGKFIGMQVPVRVPESLPLALQELGLAG